MTTVTRYATAALPLLVVALGACDSTVGGPTTGQPVNFAVASRPGSAAAGAIRIDAFRLAVGGVALGAGNEFGCKDCTGSQASVPPAIVEVPLDGSSAQVRTEEVAPGTYSEAEVEVAKATAELLKSVPSWGASTTLQLSGSFDGRPFDLQVAIEGTFRETLATPLVVGSSGGSGSAQITFTLPVDKWFTGSAGLLDPTSATDRQSIEANIRSSFGPAESGKPEDSR